ncbi:MAG: VOC family protein [Micromonosporaceae bacterium]
MPSSVYNIAIDCADAYGLATFWSVATGRPLGDDDVPGDPVAVITLETGVNLYFAQVPEPKTTKNRLHICLRPDGPRDAEVDRLIAAGGTLIADLRDPDGTGWAVVADPEGNEFCVLRSAAEVEATSPRAAADADS